MLPLTIPENLFISFYMSHLLRWLMVVACFHFSNKGVALCHIKNSGLRASPALGY